jgi:hypothetical protein
MKIMKKLRKPGRSGWTNKEVGRVDKPGQPPVFLTAYDLTLECADSPPDAGDAVQSEVVRRRI